MKAIQTTPNGYARPERVIADSNGLMGLFCADGDCFQYDSWLFWGEDTPENRKELEAAGVPIEEREVLDGPPLAT